jgi:PAS domain S-box-containing protein
VSGSGTGSRRGGHSRSDQTAPRAISRQAPTPGEPRPAARADRIDHKRAFVVLRSAQRALLRAEDEAELLDSICRISVDEAGYCLAWVGLAQDDLERTVRPVAQAGYEAGYLESITITWADTPLGRGPTGTAIRTGRPVVGRSFLTDPELAPWREQALQHGFASSLALPLRADDRPFGALSIYATTPNAFSVEDVELLTGLADDLAFGITTLRTHAAAVEVLRRSERNLAEAQRIAHIGSWTLDPMTGDATWSSEMYGILGRDSDGPALGLADISSLFSHDSVSLVTAAVERAVQTGEPWQMDLELARPDGRPGWVASHGIAERGATGVVVRIRGTMQDITEQVAAEQERARLFEGLRRSERNLAEAQRIAHIGSWEWDLATDTAQRSEELHRIYGAEPGAIPGTTEAFLAFVHPGDRARVQAYEWAAVTGSGPYVLEYRAVWPDGTIRIVHDEAEVIRDEHGAPVRIVGTVQDITERVQLEAREVRRARERALIADALEGLRPLDTAEQTAEAICRRVVELPEIAMASLLVLEPDGSALPLALIVDDGRVLERKNLGFERSAQLRTRAGQGPWVEAWRPRPGHAYLADHLAIGLRAQAYAPVRSGATLIGLLTVGSREPDAVALLTERLPAILEFASLAGALLAPSVALTSATAATRGSIQAIIDARAFHPVFQPIVELHTGAVVGYEALTRFADGALADVVFASAARVGLEVELEVATLEAALGAAAVLPPEAYLSLNASPALIGSGRLGPLLAGVDRRITLEITEHAVVADYAVLRREVAALGPTVHLAVDDAGAGYASLRHILELAPNFVKLDLGLIRGIDTDPARQALIAGMSYFAVKRNVRLVAEGIETAAELETLRSLGIPYGQGYLFGRPQDGRGPGPWPTKIALGHG